MKARIKPEWEQFWKTFYQQKGIPEPSPLLPADLRPGCIVTVEKAPDSDLSLAQHDKYLDYLYVTIVGEQGHTGTIALKMIERMD